MGWISFECREMGLWTLLEGLLLLANALAILNEDRFLVPKGWGLSDFSGGRAKSFKGQIIGLIYATQYLRVPLILFNSIFIIVKLVSGWYLARWDFNTYSYVWLKHSFNFVSRLLINNHGKYLLALEFLEH